MEKKKKNHIGEAGTRSHLWDRGLAILAMIVGLLAISGDSLLFKLMPHPMFRVFWSTALSSSGEEGSIFTIPLALRIAPSTNTIRAMAPVHVLAFMSVRNESQHPKLITDFRVEFLDDNGKWVPALCVGEMKTLYMRFSLESKTCSSWDLTNNDFVSALSNGIIDPNGVKSGWLGLNFPPPYRDRTMTDRKLRIVISTAFDPDETIALRQPKQAPGGSGLPSGAFLRKGSDVDISDVQEFPWSPSFMQYSYPRSKN